MLNACAPDVHKLASAALLTGCREGELLNATARDFDSRSKTLLVADSKSDKPRRVPLTVEGIEFFEGQTAGRKPSDRMFLRADESARWRNGEGLKSIGRVFGVTSSQRNVNLDCP